MTFSRKIFISVFLMTLVLGSALIWAAHYYVSKQTTDGYVSRYTAFSKVLGDTLSRLDTNTEALMRNAAQLVEAKDAEHGLLSTEYLKGMRKDLNVTHIFVLDKDGTFIRSTNEDPKLIPNAYSFCPSYRNMVYGTTQVEATPIVHPHPEPQPYKFLFVPTRNRERLVEVGVRVDFVAKTLTEALKSDENLLSMSLYAPDGMPFGRFSSEAVQFNGERVTLPEKVPQFVDVGDKFKFFTKVRSSHPSCCQCDVSGTSRNGEYYYVLESEISKKELAAIQATTKHSFILLALANILVAFVFSRFLSRRLVKNIETAVKKVRKIKEASNLKERLNLKGSDEVAFLTGEFDYLLDKIEISQQKIIEAEKAEAKVQMAREVAHNIRSPAIAIEMILPMLGRLPERLQKVLRDSAREIKALAEKLTREGEKRIAPVANQSCGMSLIRLVRDVIEQKRVEYSMSSDIKIGLLQGSSDDIVPVAIDPIEFRALLSNLVNNAVESYPDHCGLVEVSCYSLFPEARLVVKDFGKGISQEMLQSIEAGTFSSSKPNGSGIGLRHAIKKIFEWHGHIDVRSNLNTGTTVTITLPLAVEIAKTHAPGLSTLADDQINIHSIKG